MPIRAKDLALELGLSQSTVSRILNGDTKQRISKQTRERVLESAREKEYQPNAVARSLRRGRTNVLGLYTRHTYDARNDFLAEILGGLQHACAAHGLDLMLQIGMQNRPADEVYNALRDGRIDGLIVHSSAEDPVLSKLASSGLPIIALADPDPVLPTVTCDDASGMAQLVDYIWERGYRRFAFVEPEFDLASVHRRRETWTRMLQERGIKQNNRIVIRIPAEDCETVLEFPDLIGNIPCAVSCWNDRTAYSLLRCCRAHGIYVPEMLAVTGFDGLLDSKLPERQLVTANCRWADAAARSVELLAIRIDGGLTDIETRMPVYLIGGDTV